MVVVAAVVAAVAEAVGAAPFGRRQRPNVVRGRYGWWGSENVDFVDWWKKLELFTWVKA